MGPFLEHIVLADASVAAAPVAHPASFFLDGFATAVEGTNVDGITQLVT